MRGREIAFSVSVEGASKEELGVLRVTLREVADKAGVTPSIVSRVLNGKPEVRVAEETRARILEAARELDYRPDPYAQALQSGESSTIILVAPLSFFLMNARKTVALQKVQARGRSGLPLVSPAHRRRVAVPRVGRS